jgi:putative transposase
MRATPLITENFYHLYNRGVNRGLIFFQPENWSFFLHRMHQYFITTKVELLAYALMPNHYHLLVRVKCNDFGRDIMQPFMVSYTLAINKQMNRVGPLFQGPYQARHVTNDADVLNLSSYIHLNPVASGLVVFPEQWEYSSYKDYLGLRCGRLVSQSFILSKFPSRQAYADYQHDQIKCRVPSDLIFD